MSGTAIGACEERIFAIERDGPDCAFDDIAVDLDVSMRPSSMNNVSPLPLRRGIADRLRQFALLTDRRELFARRGFEGIDDRAALLLPNGAPLIRAASSQVFLDSIEDLDPLERLHRDRCHVRRSKFVEAATRMRPAEGPILEPLREQGGDQAVNWSVSFRGI